jgi:2-haloacid dehalogenase
VTSPATPTAVVFDLGGVLIRWDPRHLYRRLLPEDEVDAFLDEVGFHA